MGIGFSELVIIAIAALVVVHPTRIPTFLDGLARFIRSCRSTIQDIRTHFTRDV